MAQVRKTITSPKGTELPLLNLKGKEYLAVAHRLVLFRESNPGGIIKTTMLAMNGEGSAEYAVFKAEIFVETEKGHVCIASAHKKETRGGFDDFIEKAETGSVGRALTIAGYGLQFVGDELDEKDRLADAPLPVFDKTVNTGSTATNGSGVDATIATLAKRTSFRKPTTPTASTEDI